MWYEAQSSVDQIHEDQMISLDIPSDNSFDKSDRWSEIITQRSPAALYRGNIKALPGQRGERSRKGNSLVSAWKYNSVKLIMKPEMTTSYLASYKVVKVYTICLKDNSITFF